jgi:hypothetical protein
MAGAARTVATPGDLTLTSEEGNARAPHGGIKSYTCSLSRKVTQWNTPACVNLIVDVLYAFLNPKIRYSG